MNYPRAAPEAGGASRGSVYGLESSKKARASTTAPEINTSGSAAGKEVWNESLKLLAKLVEAEQELTSVSHNVVKLEQAEKAERQSMQPEETLLAALSARIDEARKTKVSFEAQRNAQMDDLTTKFARAMNLSRPKTAAASPSTPNAPAAVAQSFVAPRPPPVQPSSMAHEEMARLKRALDEAERTVEASKKLNEELKQKCIQLEGTVSEIDVRVKNWSSIFNILEMRLPGGLEGEGKMASVEALDALSTRLNKLETAAPPDPRLRSGALSSSAGATAGSVNPYAAVGSTSRSTLEGLEKRVQELETKFTQHRESNSTFKRDVIRRVRSLEGKQPSTGGGAGPEDASTEMLVGDVRHDTALEVGLERRVAQLESQLQLPEADTALSLKVSLNGEIEARQKLNNTVRELNQWKEEKASVELAQVVQDLAGFENFGDNLRYTYNLVDALYDKFDIPKPDPDAFADQDE